MVWSCLFGCWMMLINSWIYSLIHSLEVVFMCAYICINVCYIFYDCIYPLYIHYGIIAYYRKRHAIEVECNIQLQLIIILIIYTIIVNLCEVFIVSSFFLPSALNVCIYIEDTHTHIHHLIYKHPICIYVYICIYNIVTLRVYIIIADTITYMHICVYVCSPLHQQP